VSITTHGWGDENITVAGWGGAGYLRRAFKRFILYIARRLGLGLLIDREAFIPTEIDVSVVRLLAIPVRIERTLAMDVMVSRRISIAVLIDPEEV
jgi:hypothetical protein